MSKNHMFIFCCCVIIVVVVDAMFESIICLLSLFFLVDQTDILNKTKVPNKNNVRTLNFYKSYSKSAIQ